MESVEGKYVTGMEEPRVDDQSRYTGHQGREGSGHLFTNQGLISDAVRPYTRLTVDSTWSGLRCVRPHTRLTVDSTCTYVYP